MPIAASASARPAKIASSSARNRGRAAESENTWSIVRSLTIGSVGSCARTRLLDLLRERSLRRCVERTTTFMLPARSRSTRGPCSLRKYSSVPVLLAIPPCFTSRTTPTIVNGVVSFGAGREDVDPLADRLELAEREEGLLERLVDQHDRRAGDVGWLEAAPLHDRDPHRLQVVERDGLVVVDVLGRLVPAAACSPRSRCRSH